MKGDFEICREREAVLPRGFKRQDDRMEHGKKGRFSRIFRKEKLGNWGNDGARGRDNASILDAHPRDYQGDPMAGKSTWPTVGRCRRRPCLVISPWGTRSRVPWIRQKHRTFRTPGGRTPDQRRAKAMWWRLRCVAAGKMAPERGHREALAHRWLENHRTGVRNIRAESRGKIDKLEKEKGKIQQAETSKRFAGLSGRDGK